MDMVFSSLDASLMVCVHTILKAHPKAYHIYDENLDQFEMVQFLCRQLVESGTKECKKTSQLRMDILIKDNWMTRKEISIQQEYQNNILQAIYEDAINVTAYTVWSLMDDFELLAGYTKFQQYLKKYILLQIVVEKNLDFPKLILAVPAEHTLPKNRLNITRMQLPPNVYVCTVAKMMLKISISIFCVHLLLRTTWGEPINKTFPANFLFGTATASYQVEGGWLADGKGENIWDHFTHTHPELIANNANGNVACDSYHKYMEDVEMLKNLGVNYYRFSLSWSRILPSGLIYLVNQPGVDYYKNLIKALKENGIEPYVTLYHWDLPQPLQELGGWPNPLLVDYFADYARLAFTLFGDDVKNWMTFNEAKQTCQMGYGYGSFAPGYPSNGIGSYLCAHTFGWYANPVYHPDGNYPQVMIDRIADRSQKENFPKSRLPEFTQEEIDYIKGTYDFFALNVYTTSLAKWSDDYPIGDPSWDADISVTSYQDPSWNSSASGWLKVVPWGTRKLLNWIDQTYNHPEIVITENGYSDHGELDDQDRINYYAEYLSNILLAILEDGVNVTGYTAWSLMDNFEWLSGYTEKFGLYQVDFDSPDRTRTIKQSGEYYKNVIATKCLVDTCEE
ncbi:myrosinase 1 [Asbolus verrucosus]|uniref:Myrosinase 1 n=1 Tax=Asbolus verrucosus TaxID=1661398 RepID=A0A482VYI7_ASBVE|nr:myrosinase 1 [Asbolus verrucosus]